MALRRERRDEAAQGREALDARLFLAGNAREVACLPREALQQRAAQRGIGSEALEMLEPGEEPVADHIGAPGEPVIDLEPLDPIRCPVAGGLPGRLASDRGNIAEPLKAVQRRAPFLAGIGAPGRRGCADIFVLEAEFA